MIFFGDKINTSVLSLYLFRASLLDCFRISFKIISHTFDQWQTVYLKLSNSVCWEILGSCIAEIRNVHIRCNWFSITVRVSYSTANIPLHSFSFFHRHYTYFLDYVWKSSDSCQMSTLEGVDDSSVANTYSTQIHSIMLNCFLKNSSKWSQ